MVILDHAIFVGPEGTDCNCWGGVEKIASGRLPSSRRFPEIACLLLDDFDGSSLMILTGHLCDQLRLQASSDAMLFALPEFCLVMTRFGNLNVEYVNAVNSSLCKS